MSIAGRNQMNSVSRDLVQRLKVSANEEGNSSSGSGFMSHFRAVNGMIAEPYPVHTQVQKMKPDCMYSLLMTVRCRSNIHTIWCQISQRLLTPLIIGVRNLENLWNTIFSFYWKLVIFQVLWTDSKQKDCWKESQKEHFCYETQLSLSISFPSASEDMVDRYTPVLNSLAIDSVLIRTTREFSALKLWQARQISVFYPYF